MFGSAAGAGFNKLNERVATGADAGETKLPDPASLLDGRTSDKTTGVVAREADETLGTGTLALTNGSAVGVGGGLIFNALCSPWTWHTAAAV